MAADEEDLQVFKLPLSCSPEEDFNPLASGIASPRIAVSDSSEKSDSLSDLEDKNAVLMEYELYGKTPPSASRATSKTKTLMKTKISKEATKSAKRKSISELSRSRRQSANAALSARAFNRSFKEKESSCMLFNDEHEAIEDIPEAGRQRLRSSTESSIITRKLSQRKYKCLKYKESSSTSATGSKDTNAKTAACIKRVQFYDTLNLLINLGQGGNPETKEKLENENYEVEELREAIWLELQAWHNNTTMLEQDEYLMSARTNINGIVDDVINFHVDDSKTEDDESSLDSDSETDSEDDYCISHRTLPSDCNIAEPNDLFGDIESISSTTDAEMQTKVSDRSSSVTSLDNDAPKLSEFAQSVKTAVTQVSSILKKLYTMEQLYPSRDALRKDFKKYTAKEFNKSLDTMVIWLNIINGLYHKLHVMSKIVHVDVNDAEMWKDWIELGLGFVCATNEKKCLKCEEVASNCDYDVVTSTESPKRGLSYETSSTSRYRQFVDQNIKKMGVAKLGYKMHEIMHTQLAKALVTLQVDWSRSAFLEHHELHILFHSLLVKSMDGAKPNFDPHDTKKTYDINVFEIPEDDWKQRFHDMGLPSYDKLHIFLVCLVMDIYHECLRMRMEHRPKGEPSSLSVRQLIEECKEVLTAAVVVRQFFLDTLETLGKDISVSHKWEERITEFEQDIQKMLKVYFEYLHVLMLMLQRLPQASCGVKDILEEEWEFVNQLTPYIRGGRVQAGNRFCVMAGGLMQSTADFLETGMDEYFSGLHGKESNEKSMVKVLQSCRHLKKLFKETRERSVKALAFVKRLKNDLGVAATFHITGSVPELLQKLKDTDYVQVILTMQSLSVMIFVQRSLATSISCINELVNACCGLHCQQKSCCEGMQNYIVLVHKQNDEECLWTGDSIYLNPVLDTSLALENIQVDELAIVACSSCELQFHLGTFKNHMGETVNCLSSAASCHHDLIDMEIQIKDAMVNLRKKICDALDGAVENFDVDKMYIVEKSERTRLCRSVLEALQFAFNAVFDFHREIKKIPSPDEPTMKIVGKYYLDVASKWMDFVLKRCEKGKGRRPRWAIQGLKFLIEACHPSISGRLSDCEFENFQKQINTCIDHVIGSAEQNNTPSNSRGTSDWLYSRISRSSTFPGTMQSPHSHPTRAFSEPGVRPALKRGATMHDGDQPDDDEMEYPLPRIFRVRSCIVDLENSRHQQLLDKGVIGRVSNKKRDLAGELAVIPKRVPFKWQRGNKIGEGRFGKVYACVNLDTEEVVAMKQITFHPNDHSAFQDLADEIKAFESLNHDSLVKYYGCEVHRDVMYIFMEYCGDGTISDVSKLGLPEAMIRKYADQILVAVEFLHDCGIVHRDIKGPNIFLSSEGLIKLGDFGASVKLGDPLQTMCGEVSTLRGTINYMAPEVITLDKGAGYGRAADIWSVGCVVVEMASGKPPWMEFDNQWAIMLKVGEGSSPVIPEYLSDEGKDFLANCFVHDPHERWTARQLHNHTFLKCC